MTKRELKSKVEELEKQLNKFKKELDRVNENPYGNLIDNKQYFCVYSDGTIGQFINTGSIFDKSCYEYGNYFSDKDFAKKVAAEQTLTNLLRKYTYEHGWSDDLWDDENSKYKIRYNNRDLCFDVDTNQFFKSVNLIYFINETTAKNAIKDVAIPFVKEHPELGYELRD